ncbi:hypothetical protein OHA38_20445 [Streptomyces sp. NBC_01732]|uniref:hypothetical protein n=1 Tax=unclassified Streptomyces TaxID=2593676 RepID=UPI001661D158|nr:hypothetical protein [Streptomyces sp. CBMA370]MBD0712556.1 hypothetical protein [Streptomyces sp. CBMA370]WSG51978.1 hypothetical protein OHA38_20445 [Streptomyces sp. NBC_01732]
MPAKKPATTELGEVLSIDLDSLSIDEIETIEEIIDGPLDDLAKPGARKAKMLRAMALVIMQRKDPSFTAADAGKLRISLKGKKKADPTQRSA